MQLARHTLNPPFLRQAPVRRPTPRRASHRRPVVPGARWRLDKSWKWPLLALGASIWLAMVGAIANRELNKNAQAADVDPMRGKSFYRQSCIACHGPDAQGMPHQGANLRHSKFIAKHSDEALRNFIKAGRKANDPESIQGLIMPARGGNPSLDEGDLLDIVAYLRQIQKQASVDQPEEDEAASASAG